MNKFVRQYLLLPFCFFFVIFPLFFLTGCACLSVSSGSEIQVKVVYSQNSKKKDLPIHNKNVFKRLLLQVNQKWFFDKNLKKRSEFQKYLENKIQNISNNPETKKQISDIKSFVDVAFYKSENSRYYKTEFFSKKQEFKIYGKKKLLWASEFLKKQDQEKRTLEFNLWFQSENANQKWKVTMEIQNLKIKKDGFFDIGKTFQAQVFKCFDINQEYRLNTC